MHRIIHMVEHNQSTNDTDNAEEYIGKPFKNPESDSVILGYVMKLIDATEEFEDHPNIDKEALKMCSTCASPKDVLRAQSQIPDQTCFGREIPYLTCDYCGEQMRVETVEEVNSNEVEALYQERQEGVSR